MKVSGLPGLIGVCEGTSPVEAAALVLWAAKAEGMAARAARARLYFIVEEAVEDSDTERV